MNISYIPLDQNANDIKVAPWLPYPQQYISSLYRRWIIIVLPLSQITHSYRLIELSQILLVCHATSMRWQGLIRWLAYPTLQGACQRKKYIWPIVIFHPHKIRKMYLPSCPRIYAENLRPGRVPRLSLIKITKIRWVLISQNAGKVFGIRGKTSPRLFLTISILILSINHLFTQMTATCIHQKHLYSWQL